MIGVMIQFLVLFVYLYHLEFNTRNEKLDMLLDSVLRDIVNSCDVMDYKEDVQIIPEQFERSKYTWNHSLKLQNSNILTYTNDRQKQPIGTKWSKN